MTASSDVRRDLAPTGVLRAAYDLYLTRTLWHAEIVRAPTGAEAIERFLRERCEAAAGVKNPLARYVSDRPDLRVLPGRFMVIEQAMGTRKGRDIACRYLASFVEEMKANGFVAAALQRSGQLDARVAPSSL